MNFLRSVIARHAGNVGNGSSRLLRSLALLLCLSMLWWQAQAAPAEVPIRGKVTDEAGAGLPGVSVVEKGTTNGATTDASGQFSLNVRGNKATVVFSFVGYLAQELAVGSQSVFNVSLKPGTATLDEVVVVGYGTQRKATVTGAVVAVQGSQLIRAPTADLGSSLAGRLPGLVVVQTSGEPGQDAARISIRGTNTLGNSNPLIVIDGIPDRDGGISRLSSYDIGSISVLKDASAAIYGARAANGAIIVTTKRGKAGKPVVSYDMNFGLSQPTRVPQMSSASEYASIMNELPIYKTIPVNEWQAASTAIKTTGTYTSPTAGISPLSANFSPDAVKKFADGSDPWRFPNTDWFGGSFRTWAPQVRHNLSVSGGTDAVKYFASVGYTFQDAVYKNSSTNYSQYNVRTNVDAKVNDYIHTSIGLHLRRELRNLPTESSGAIFRMLMRGRPTEPQVWPTGQPGPDIENGQNPYVISTNATGYSRNTTDYIQTNANVDITNPWVKGLRLTLSAAVDKSDQNNRLWQTPWSLYYWDKKTYEADGVTPKLEGSIRSNFKDPRLNQTYSTIMNTNLTGLLNYDFTIGNGHEFNALAGVTKEVFAGEGFLAFRRNFISPAVDQLFAGGTDLQNTNGTAYNRTRLGYYGRAQYAYKSKYLAEFIWRYDGSYIFPASNRFGFFPGLLLGWNLSEESFFKVPGIDYMKLRASYGQMGNDQVFYNGALQEFAYLATYGFGQYPINGSVATTLRETVLANPDFTWERANNLNVGLDATFLNGKLDLVLEYFNNRRDQILIQKTGSTPASSGITTLLPPVNAGKVENAGFEFSLNYNIKTTSDLTLRAGINGGYARNKVLFMDEVPGAPDYQRMEGKPIGAYLVYQDEGVFRDQAAITENKIDYSAVAGKLLPGDMRFQDYNGDNKINADDAVRINRNNVPTFNFGTTFEVRYRNWNLNMLWQGATGASVFVQTESGDIGNYLKYDYDNRWSIDNPSSVAPRLASRGDTYYTGGNFGNNTYFLRSRDYIRLKNLELSYSLPLGVISRVGLGSARVFVNGQNLLTFDALKIYDPESATSPGQPSTNGITFNSTSSNSVNNTNTGNNGQVYPLSRIINTGLAISF
jgi:TonB-dependent starch-binding outer membrane protein SusC